MYNSGFFKKKSSVSYNAVQAQFLFICMYCTSGKMTDKNKSLPYCRRTQGVRWNCTTCVASKIPKENLSDNRRNLVPNYDNASSHKSTELVCLLRTVINAPKKQFPFGLVIFSSHFGSRLEHRCRIYGLPFHLFFLPTHISPQTKRYGESTANIRSNSQRVMLVEIYWLTRLSTITECLEGRPAPLPSAAPLQI